MISILNCQPRQYETGCRISADSHEEAMKKAEDRARFDSEMDYNGRAIIRVSEVKPCKDRNEAENLTFKRPLLS